MRNSLFKISIVLVLAMMMVVALPSSYAKYADAKVYTINLKRTVKYDVVVLPKVLKSTAYNNYPSSTYTIGKHEGGWYAFVLKGGNGSMGIKLKSSALGGVGDGASGGQGGVIAFCKRLNDNDVVVASVGCTGEEPAWLHIGEGGKNTTSIGAGGKGAIQSLNAFESVATSGGGGGASIITLGNGSPSQISNVLAIAAGGGSGASKDVGKTYEQIAGAGGAGGSNYKAKSGQQSSTISTGVVYFGFDGIIENGTNLVGKGGNTAGGIACNSNANSGKSFAEGGTGASTVDGQVGGAGGGGYCGGSSGVGTVKRGAYMSGGGGGSSYLANGTVAMTDAIYNYVISKTNCNVSQLGGFVAIVYLGNSETPVVPAD